MLKSVRYDRSVKPQEVIQAFDPLCEVQSDKASVEITSPFDGVIKELLVQEGEVAKVGAGLCLIEVDEETAESSADLAPVDPVNSPAPSEATTFVSKSDTPKAKEPDAESVSRPRLHPLDPNYTPDTSLPSSSNVLATPSVRHFSRQRGVDLAQLAPGSGKGGRIEKKDVEVFLVNGGAGKAGRGGVETRVEDEKDVVVELGRTRYGMWKAMVKVLFVSAV
jgi:2-oxoisovalerate dehydrogenase E2 component (dihydrolipoyl transacylase)